MKTYTITVKYLAQQTITVKAKNEEEAIMMAEDTAYDNKDLMELELMDTEVSEKA